MATHHLELASKGGFINGETLRSQSLLTKAGIFLKQKAWRVLPEQEGF